MAKSKKIKRVVVRSGEVRYYRNGKRLKNKTGQRKWIKDNQSVNPQELTKKEQTSLKAVKKYNDGYKFNGWPIQSIYVELLKKLAVPISQAKNKDLATIINADGKPLFANFMDVLKMIDNKAKSDKKFLQFCSEVGLPNYRNRNADTFKDNKIKSVVDFVDLLDSDGFKTYTLEIYDTFGDSHRGRVRGILALRDFEIMVGERIQKVANNSAFLRFCYDYHLNIPKREIFIDLSDINEDKDLEDYVNEAKNKSQGTSININNKYKDVLIEIMFS